jgi:hypothetical protein
MKKWMSTDKGETLLLNVNGVVVHSHPARKDGWSFRYYMPEQMHITPIFMTKSDAQRAALCELKAQLSRDIEVIDGLLKHNQFEGRSDD